MSELKKKVEPNRTHCFNGFDKTKRQGEDHDSTKEEQKRDGRNRQVNSRDGARRFREST